MEVRVARIFNTFGPRMHMNDGESDIRDCSFFTREGVVGFRGAFNKIRLLRGDAQKNLSGTILLP